MLGREDLLITGSTLGNPPFESLAQAASAGGFRGLSLWPGPTYYAARKRGLSDADLRAILDDHGLVVNDVDAVLAWVGTERPAVIDAEHPSEEEMYAAGAALGARFANIVFIGSKTLEIERAAEMFAGMCERAESYGLVGHIEFVPSISPIDDAATAWKVVQASGRSEAGVLIDTWHANCGSTTDADLRSLPGDRVLGIQINDAPDLPARELVKIGMTGRQVPGEGCMDLVGFLGILDEIGCDAPLTVEVFSDSLPEQHGPVELARRLGEGLRGVLARARASEGSA